MMPLLRISKKLSKAEARMAMEPVKNARKALVRNKTMLATNDKLMAKWISQGDEASFVCVSKGALSSSSETRVLG